jgi:hypothetical protein
VPPKRTSKAKSTKRVVESTWTDQTLWTVCRGELRKSPGRPEKTRSLFRLVAEKLPFDSLQQVRRSATDLLGSRPNGVYVAHDSMGYARYIGRGNIFGRLYARKRAQKAELLYFSFYVVEHKKHEREIETLLIRAAGPQLHFNTKKRRIDIQPGDVRDFEAGTAFFERRPRRKRRSQAERISQR